MTLTLTPSPGSEALEVAATTGLIGYRLRRTQLAVFNRFLSTFAELELRPADYSVLVLIADNPGRKQTEIAEVLGIKRANFVTLIDGLERRGLIERRSVPGDGRANALHLTAEGKLLVTRARALHDTLEGELIDRVGGPEARDTLLALLERLA